MDSNTPLGRKVTVSDIAAGCGVSRATVSLVLRGSPLVNKDTRARVEEELRKQVRDKKERHRMQCERALAAFDSWLEERAPATRPIGLRS